MPSSPRIILFVLGGMTFSEIKSVHQLSKELKRDIYIASTHVLNPTRFMSSLMDLNHSTPKQRSKNPFAASKNPFSSTKTEAPSPSGPSVPTRQQRPFVSIPSRNPGNMISPRSQGSSRENTKSMSALEQSTASMDLNQPNSGGIDKRSSNEKNWWSFKRK
jgi:hypothetical protein